MKVLVTGANGMLGQDLAPELRCHGHDVHALSREQLDVTDRRAVERTLHRLMPDAVVQCAAFTAVDAAEEAEASAYEVNAESTRHLARACYELGAALVYPSSDYVFFGDSTEPYKPGDPTLPLNAYGRTKLAGEEAAAEAKRALIVRTSWLYGAGGDNFVATISRLARERGVVQVVDDQIGRPTWTRSLAGVIRELLERNATGTFHASDGGEAVSWYGFARELLRLQQIDAEVHPVPTTAFPRPAPRPSFSVLDCTATERVLERPLRDWRNVIADYLQLASPAR